MIYFNSSYLDRKFDFAKDDIKPSLKDEKWFLTNVKAAYSMYLNNLCAIKYSDQDYYGQLRRYAEGKQSQEYYKTLLLGEPSADRKGFMNVDWSIFSPAPAYLAQILGIFENQDHEIQAISVDPKAGMERERQKFEKLFRKTFYPQLTEIEKIKGQKQTEPEYLPESRDELEMFASIGGFKLPYETQSEEALRDTFYSNDWKEIKRKLIYDLCVINMCAIMDEVDPYTQKVKPHYSPAEDLIIEHSQGSGFDNSRFAGAPIDYTVQDLRTSGCNLTEEQLLGFIRKYEGYNGNPIYIQYNNVYQFDTWNIPVLYFTIKSVNTYYTGKKYYRDTIDANGNKKSEIDKSATSSYDVRVVYHGKWIIGTEHIFGFGLLNDMARPNIKDVKLPFHVYKLNGTSIIAQCRPCLDQIQLTKLKYESAKAHAAPPGIAVEWGSVENFVIQNKQMEPLDILAIRNQSGDFLYRRTTVEGERNLSAGYPFQELKGGMGNCLTDAVQSFELEFNLITRITGLDQYSLNIAKPSSETTATAIKTAVASTNNVLKPLYAGLMNVKERLATSMAYKIQLICMYNKDRDRGYEDIIGKTGVEILKAAGDKVPMQFGVHFIASPTAEDYAEIRNAALVALKSGKNGKPVISMSDYFFILNVSRTGAGLQYAQAYLAYREQKTLQEDSKLQQENMAIQAKNNQEYLESQEALKKQFIEFSETVKGQVKILVDNAQEENKRQTIILQKQLEHGNKLEQTEFAESMKQGTI